jgi:dihydroxy-acid dehydratase
LQTGDTIEVELAQNRIHACVTEAEFIRRRESWTPHTQSGVTNFLSRYAHSVGSSRTGAVVK